ncbi:hypothetical protein ATKI12_6799 [Kitasatospora sp. Ki12]|uniref:hypothetical protein n=1 Tax=Kitasatospora xanthocidica TaxID=83382 RepID=UPI00167B552B|nr:hypothetical protein [Kitasatospora xanthocidica]GHF63689.1 hypothetical protein GCM10018790_46980 [Kitasatospora xanthocidica]
MSVSAAFHSVVPDVRHRSRGLRTALARVLDRLSASPLDSSVLGALGAPRPARPHARWYPVTRPDGTTALEARWETDH